MTKPSPRMILISLIATGLLLAVGLSVLRQTQGEPAPSANAQSTAEDAGAQAAAAASDAEIEDKADELLRSMGDYLGRMKSFSVNADHVIEVTTKEGEKLEFGATSEVFVERPNKLRTNRKGEVADLSFYYDGKELTVFGRGMQMYATAPAPATLDEAIAFGRDALELEAPGADLLYSDPYEYLIDAAESGRYIGTTVVRGVTCSHLAFRNETTDWQIWIAEGAAPLPCKYVVTSKDLPGAPQFSVVFYDWDTQPDFPDGIFRFTPPAGAAEIDFFQVEEPGKTQESNNVKTAPKSKKP